MIVSRGRRLFTVQLFFILTAFVQFVCLFFIEHHLDKEQFSKVSTMLALLPVYLIFVELGIQGDLIRRFAQDVHHYGAPLGMGLCVRWLGASFGFAVLLFQNKLLFTDASLAWSLVFLGSCYFFAAVLLTGEALGFALNKISYIIQWRLARLISIVCFTLILLIIIDSTGGFALALPMAFLCFLLVPGLFSLNFILLNRNGWAGFKKLNIVSATVGFFLESRNLIINRILIGLYGSSFYALNIDWHGVDQLAELNLAFMLLAPLSLILQVIIYDQLGRKFRRQGATMESTSPRQKLNILWLALFVTACIFLPYVIEMIFKDLDGGRVQQFFVPLSLGVLFAAVVDYLLVLLQEQRIYWLAYVCPCISLSVLGAFWIFGSSVLFKEYTGWVYCLSFWAALLFCLLANWSTTLRLLKPGNS